MNNNLVVLPIVIPLITGIFLLFFRENIKLNRAVSAMVSVVGLGLSFYLMAVVQAQGIQLMTAGNWQPPFGIVMVADTFSVIMVILANIIGTACVFYSFVTIDEGREQHYYYPLIQLLLVGINGSFLTGDIFNLFVFFEIMLLASYSLIVLGGEKPQLRETIKYVVINMLSSTMFLVAVALTYSVAGTLNMADLAVKMPQVANQGIVTVIAIMYMLVFAVKGALFPLYFWMPKAYCTPPTAITALFGGLLTKVGVYALIRVFTLIFIGDIGYTHNIILVLGGFTMLLGVLATIPQMDFKSILSYHIISQVGYMVMGLGIYTTLSIAGAILYIAHNIIVKSCLFLISGVTEKITGTTDLLAMGGLLKHYPMVGWLFFVAGISLAGVPPFSGFFSKFVIMQAGLLEGRYLIVAVSLLVGLLTLFSMMKIFMKVYWGEEKGIPAQRVPYGKMIPSAVALVALSVFIGFNAEWIFSYAMLAAEELMNPEIYINAVLAKE
jgi:multicomponent Na+:H+ antiporter subunit D